MVKNILGVLQNILGVLRVLEKKGCRKLISLVEILSAVTFSARLSLDEMMRCFWKKAR